MNESWGSNIEIKGMYPPNMLKLHKATREAIEHTIDDQRREKFKLRKRMVELEVSLSP